MKENSSTGAEIRYAASETDAATCYPLMRQLRPHLASEAEFIERWRRQETAGYRLKGLWQNGRLIALAGVRVVENLVYGVHFYIDDLVTSEEARGTGAGSQLLSHLQEEARALGCAKLVLDTGLSNVLAQRFYYRNGLLITALRFSMPLI